MSEADGPRAPIAVVGMGCRLPGAENPAELRELLEGAWQIASR